MCSHIVAVWKYKGASSQRAEQEWSHGSTLLWRQSKWEFLLCAWETTTVVSLKMSQSLQWSRSAAKCWGRGFTMDSSQVWSCETLWVWSPASPEKKYEWSVNLGWINKGFEIPRDNHTAQMVQFIIGALWSHWRSACHRNEHVPVAASWSVHSPYTAAALFWTALHPRG